MKGSAAVVGFEDVGRYAHGVEEKLGQLRSGSVAPTTAIIDALLVAVDRLGSMIWESVGGQDVDESANAACAQLASMPRSLRAEFAPPSLSGADRRNRHARATPRRCGRRRARSVPRHRPTGRDRAPSRRVTATPRATAPAR